MKTTNEQRQEIFNQLSKLEAKLYYLEQNPEGLPFAEVSKIHENIDKSLMLWHQITGCINQ